MSIHYKKSSQNIIRNIIYVTVLERVSGVRERK